FREFRPPPSSASLISHSTAATESQSDSAAQSCTPATAAPTGRWLQVIDGPLHTPPPGDHRNSPAPHHRGVRILREQDGYRDELHRFLSKALSLRRALSQLRTLRRCSAADPDGAGQARRHL